MKLLFVVAISVGVVCAETPSRYPEEFQRVQAPYQPSGWRPTGAAFRLPERQQQVPQAAYGAPAQQYGPPPPTTTESPEATTTDLPATTTQASRRTANLDRKQNLEDAVTNQGVYYVYHPTGLLQRVVYVTKDDLKNMAYTAQLKYQDVEPIREPIYTYDPNTFTLQKLQI